MGRIIRWSSRVAVSAYSQLCMVKGRLTAWRLRSGKDETGDATDATFRKQELTWR